MVKRVMSSLLVAVFAAGSATAAAGDLKTADEVVAKYIEAVGGRKALANTETRRAAGKTIMGQGMEMPIVTEFKRPDKVRVEMTLQGKTIVQVYDGEIGWSINPFMGSETPQKMPSEQLDQFKGDADMDGPLVDYAKKGNKLELLGKEEIEGTDAYRLKVTHESGSVAHYFIDAEYFLPIKIKRTLKMQGTEVEQEETPGDYKEVEGVMIPHTVTQQFVGMPMTITMTFDKIEVNVDIPDARFAMPEAESLEKPEAKPAPGEKSSDTKKDDK
jgi:outer membrane lipoprotein-sorting protein